MFLLLIALLIFPSLEIYSNIIISEVCTFNAQSYYDEDMKSPDWIEIYNSGSKAINLKNYRIYDNDNFENAWVFPDTVLAPHSYLIVFASGENRVRSENFTIESSGEGIAIFNEEEGMSFLYVPVSGDFDASIDVRAMNNFGNESRIALMYREKLEDESRYASIVALNPDNGDQRLLFKTEEGGYAEQRFFYNRKMKYPWGRLRLQRENDSINAYIWDENAFWYNIDNSCDYPLKSDEGYLGIAVASGDKSITVKAVIRNFIVNGKKINFEDLNIYEVNCGSPGKFYYSKEFHSNFNLNKDGDSLFLWDSDGLLIQRVEIPPLRNDLSYGFSQNDNNQWKYFAKPTPGEENKEFGYDGIVENPMFSTNPGFYQEQINVSLTSSDPFAVVYYTLDGSTPTEKSQKYLGEIIKINTTTVIRAIAVRDNFINSEIMNGTFFIKDTSKLPVISFITDERNLYDEENGIFVEKNWYSDLEVPCYFEFWDENKILACKSNAGAKLHGQRSKTFPQKSVRVYAKTRYNADFFEYPFFGDYGSQYYKSLIFRNGGTDWEKTIFRDGWASWLSKQIPTLDAMGFRPAVMYLNGKFYGIQNVRERIDENYLSIKYGIPVDSINLLEDWERLFYGTSRIFHLFKDSLLSMDVTSDEAYEFLERNIDIPNLRDYVIFELFLANIDWPWKNLKFWQSKDYDGKWRWILNDLDYICGIGSFPDLNMFTTFEDTAYKFNQWFPKLFENNKFKKEFINRYADLTNTVFLPSNTIKLVDSVANIFAMEMPRQRAKYDSISNDWNELVEQMKEFLQRRPPKFIKHCKEYFNLTDSLSVNLNIVGCGKIKINSIIPDKYPWSGIYFTEIPITMQAIPDKGFEFIGWSVDSLKGEIISLILSEPLSLTAIFRKKGIDTNIVINEIMFKNHLNFDSDDWFELYNNGNIDIDLKDWIFKDDNNEHNFVFTENTLIKKGEFLVVSQDTIEFKKYYPKVKNVTGSFEFGLGSKDEIKIYSPEGVLQDSVAYSNEYPWYPYCNGSGYSLELKDVNLDNILAENWNPSYNLYGTPGEINSLLEVIDSASMIDDIIFPNPVKDYAYIRFQIKNQDYFKLIIINYLGEQIKVLDNIFVSDGDLIKIDCSDLVTGYYLLLIESERSGKKFIKFNVIKV